jgi:DNA-binding NarL/FixJ family response regulator
VSSPRPPRIAIVEDNEDFRLALTQAIDADPGLMLAGAAATVHDGRLLLLNTRPDVLLVDLGLPDGSGLALIREAAQSLPGCDVMVITIFGDERHVLESIEAGATGYLLKSGLPMDVAAQVRALREGGSPISPVIARRLLARLTPVRPAAEAAAEPSADDPGLSLREVAVLQYAAKGFSYDETAQLLGVTRHTVMTYVKRSYRKLQVHSKSEAVHEARLLGLLRE